jgi:predicted acetyltransferase
MLPPGVLLERIPGSQAQVLGNLYELYVHDFSELVAVDLQPSGRFEVSPGDAWWSAGDHHPFFIRHGGMLAGFALARQGSRITADRNVMDVAEFFVIRGARRKKVGRGAALALFAAFPGRWEVRVRAANEPALRFWSRAIEACVGGTIASAPFASGGTDWHVFAFETPRA